MDTPEFLVWALEYSCPIRGFQNGSDPERTERQLRAARAVSDAQREERVFEEFCLDPPHGFRVEDALAVYGGHGVVAGACVRCPANALRHAENDTLAGCFGMVTVYRLQSFFLAVDVAGEAFGSVDELIPRTTPRWYGLWIDSPIRGKRAELTARILESVVDDHKGAIPGLNGLVLAIRRASDQGLPVHVLAYPESSTEARGWWNVAAHCPRCKITWATEARRVCPTCGFKGRGVPFRKRRARGMRPYVPLQRLLGETAAAELLVRYQQYRAQREPPLPAENQLPAERRGNLPAG